MIIQTGEEKIYVDDNASTLLEERYFAFPQTQQVITASRKKEYEDIAAEMAAIFNTDS